MTMFGYLDTSSRIELGKYLENKRKKAGVSREKLGAKLGYTCGQTIFNYEKGRTTPPTKKFHKIMKHLKLNEDEIYELVSDLSSKSLKKILGI